MIDDIIKKTIDDIAKRNVLQYEDVNILATDLSVFSIFAINHYIPECFRKYIFDIKDEEKILLKGKCTELCKAHLLIGGEFFNSPCTDYPYESGYKKLGITEIDDVAILSSTRAVPVLFSSLDKAFINYCNDRIKIKEFVNAVIDGRNTNIYSNLEELINSGKKYDKILLGHIERDTIISNTDIIIEIIEGCLNENGSLVFSVENNVLSYYEQGNNVSKYEEFRNKLIEKNYVSSIREHLTGSYVVCKKYNNDNINFEFGLDKLMDVTGHVRGSIGSKFQWKCKVKYPELTIPYNKIRRHNVLCPKFYYAQKDTSNFEDECIELSEIISFGNQELEKEFLSFIETGVSSNEFVDEQYIVGGYQTEYEKIKPIDIASIECKKAFQSIRRVKGNIIRKSCSVVEYNKEHLQICECPAPTSLGFDHVYSEVRAYPFEVVSDRVVKKYLYRFLLSENIKQQIAILREVSFNSNYSKTYYFSPWTLKSILISLPTTQEQQRIVTADIEDYNNKLEEQLKKVDEDYKKTIRMRKHSIGQDIFNLRKWWDILKEGKDSGKLNDDSNIIESYKPFEVKEVFNMIESIIETTSKKIEKLTADIGATLDSENIYLPNFIEDYVLKHKRAVFNFEYDEGDFSMDAIIVNKRRDIYFPRVALTNILDNIISNAMAHGFKDITANNIIKIKTNYDGNNNIILKVSNNGCPANKSVKETDVFTWGRTSQVGTHTGIGGYEIKFLMDKYQCDIPENDRVRVIFDNESEFPVTYVLTFKSVDSNYSDLFSEY